MNEISANKTIFSGLQPTKTPHLGNYLGAIRNWEKLQNDYNCLYCVVDMHSLTVRSDPAELRKRSAEAIALYLACGLDPSKSIVYLQSHVSAHAELAWILNCFTYMGELSRMTQFKDKSAKNTDNINAGLFTYPVLMAADILLFQADVVPVGDDQRQHIEIARDIAIRFNNIYGDVFTVPEPFISKQGSRIMGLANPEGKMSKSSENENDTVFLTDDPVRILNKFKRAVTDSDTEIVYSKDKPGISNLLDIYAVCTGKTIAECEKEFSGVTSYGDFKKKVGESVVSMIEPIQNKYHDILKNKDYLNSTIKDGAEKATRLSARTLKKVCRKVGFYDRF